LGGYLATYKQFKFIALLIAASSIFFISPYAKPQYYVDRGDDFYLTNEATTTSSDELMPIWVKQKPNRRWERKVETVKEKFTIDNLRFSSKTVQFRIRTNVKTQVRINTIYYPEWKAFVDGKETKISYNNPQGLIQIQVPLGYHSVELLFTETPVRFISDLISLLSLILLVFVVKTKRISFQQ
jgi:hypothetical protein